MKILKFEPTDKETYGILSTAMRNGETQGIEQIRRVSKMLDKIEAVGSEETRSRSVEGESVTVSEWKLKEEGGTVTLEDAEYGELKQRMDATKWLPSAARRVAAAYDFLDACPEEKKAKK